MLTARALICTIFVATLVMPSVAFGQSDTFAVVSPWVVAVLQPEGKTVRLGSGFVSSNGYVVTAAHVIGSEKSPIFLAVQGDITLDRLRPAKLIRIDRDSDIAILDGGYTPPVGLLAQQAPASPGDEVWIFGYEFLRSGTAILRIARGSIGQRFEDAFQLDGPIQHGFSGGPVTTRGGRVVGIVSFGFRSSQPNLSYIVPDALIQADLGKLEPKTPPPAAAAGPIIPPLPQTNPSVRPIVRDTVVVPGQRLGPLTLTTSLTQMNSILEETPELTNDSSTGRTYAWKKYGVMVMFDSGGVPVIVGTWNPAFATTQGIRVGSSAEAVERAYGLNYQTQWADNQQSYSMTYPAGLSFVVNPSSRTVIAIAVGRPILQTTPSPTRNSGVGSLTGTYIGNYTTTTRPGTVYEAVFQFTQNGSTVVGTITSNAGKSGNVNGVVAGNRVDATMIFTDSCGGRASAVIDIVDGGRKLVGNYTATDCLGTYSGGFVLNRQ